MQRKHRDAWRICAMVGLASAIACSNAPSEREALVPHEPAGRPASVPAVQAPETGSVNAASGAAGGKPQPAADPTFSQVLFAAASASADGAAAESEASTAAATQLPIWWKTVPGQTVRGRVLSAETNEPLGGMVFTTAACEGTACSMYSLNNGNFYGTVLNDGSFEFGADAKLTLTPQTVFYVMVSGYADVFIAHGPVIPVHLDSTARTTDELRTVYMCPQQARDSDYDGICDEAEVLYGSNPNNPDADKDGLSDAMEVFGHPFNGPTNFYDLARLGADPNHADIFLGLRYTASSALKPAALAEVVKAFEGAPWTNPDGTDGIRLHIVFDDRAITGSDDFKTLMPIWPAYETLKERYFGPRPYAFHYVLFANLMQGTTSSGVSKDLGAAEFIVTMGAFKDHGTVREQAGTLMHELGHNLGLHHNGYTDENDAPHYLSIMNYAYQMNGIETTSGTVLDYSRLEFPELDENHVNENAPFTPVGATKPDGLSRYVGLRVRSLPRKEPEYNTPIMGTLRGPLDLNGDKAIEEDVAIDLNGNLVSDFYQRTRNDWDSLVLSGGPTGLIGDGPKANSKQRATTPFVELPPCMGPLGSDEKKEASESPTPSSAATPMNPGSSSATPTSASKASNTPPSTPPKQPSAQPSNTPPSQPSAQPGDPSPKDEKDDEMDERDDDTNPSGTDSNKTDSNKTDPNDTDRDPGEDTDREKESPGSDLPPNGPTDEMSDSKKPNDDDVDDEPKVPPDGEPGVPPDDEPKVPPDEENE